MIEGGAAAVAELVVRGMVEGSYEPHAIYREKVEHAPPILDELILVAEGADVGALARSAERGQIIGEGANESRDLSNRAARTTSRPRSWPRKPGQWPSSTTCGST